MTSSLNIIPPDQGYRIRYGRMRKTSQPVPEVGHCRSRYAICRHRNYWWRTTVGYQYNIIVGIIGITSEAQAVAVINAAGALLGQFYLIVIPKFLFALLLIGSSELALKEGR